jgi:ParB-like chromosome segregation protein Spo0J
MSAPIPEVELVDIGLLSEPQDNPNVMDGQTFELLLEAISKVGFLQPVLVKPDSNGGFVIVDGVHRYKAAKKLGMDEIPCVIADTVTDKNSAAVQIGMNRMRGELDLSVVSAQIAELNDSGWSIDQLTITGFSSEELDELVKAARQSAEDIMASTTLTEEDAEEEQDAKEKREFSLELTFSSKQDLNTVKKALRKAAGKDGCLGDGLLSILAQ